MPTCTNVSELEMLGSECIGIEVFFGFFWMRLYRALRGCSCGSRGSLQSKTWPSPRRKSACSPPPWVGSQGNWRATSRATCRSGWDGRSDKATTCVARASESRLAIGRNRWGMDEGTQREGTVNKTSWRCDFEGTTTGSSLLDQKFAEELNAALHHRVNPCQEVHVTGVQEPLPEMGDEPRTTDRESAPGRPVHGGCNPPEIGVLMHDPSARAVVLPRDLGALYGQLLDQLDQRVAPEYVYWA